MDEWGGGGGDSGEGAGRGREKEGQGQREREAAPGAERRGKVREVAIGRQRARERNTGQRDLGEVGRL